MVVHKSLLSLAEKLKDKSIKNNYNYNNQSIITLNLNGLNSLIERQWVTEWIKQQAATICCVQETHYSLKNTQRLKVKGYKKIFHTNGNQRKQEWLYFYETK